VIDMTDDAGRTALQDTAALPSHAQDNIQAVREFEESSEEEVSRMQAAIEKASSFFGSPAYFVFVVAFSIAWIAINAWGRRTGWTHVDAPPFFALQGLVSFNALILTVAVLIRQNRMAALAKQRAHLDLQINLLTEQKVTRLLERLDELHPAPEHADTGRRGSKEELKRPVDPLAMLQAIKDNDATSGD
jgi:uncharacterized membrane protein